MEKINLDKYQKKVIKNKSKNLLVLAGAGSGKTLTIIYKIKNLIQKGLNSNEILCITFTKAAAQSLQNKLKNENININVKTFHSLGYEIIRKSAKVTLVQENYLENIIIQNLKTYPKLTKLIPVNFIEFGKGNSEIIKNNILQNSKYIHPLKDTIQTFINLFKNNNYNVKDFKQFQKINQKQNTYQTKIRHNLFLNLVKKIFLEYENNLKYQNQIDFSDMINKAINLVKKEGCQPYKYIIIDEYQDTSLNKCLLIKAIQEKTNAKLIAVGDDWQSIYQFTGSNLDIFLNFKKYFPKAKIIKLKKTYRNSQELVNLASKFIMQNKRQINKKITSKKRTPYPVKIIYYNKNIKEIWDEIVKKSKNNILVIGRHNKDKKNIPYVKENIQYLTAHKSKGLEAESTIIINLENKINGFPNKIQNSEYLNYLIDQKNDYEEERRLFYVALTRTKSEVILLVNKQNPSPFINELLNQSHKYIKIIDIKPKIRYNKYRL